MRYYFMLSRVAIIKKIQIISVDKDVMELKPSYVAGEKVKR